MYFVSEIFEDVSLRLKSKEYIECLRRLDKKYPNLDMTKDIDFGRIWAEISYFDESGALIKKSEAFVTAYMAIRKWIQKQIKATDIHADNYIYEKCNNQDGKQVEQQLAEYARNWAETSDTD